MKNSPLKQPFAVWFYGTSGFLLILICIVILMGYKSSDANKETIFWVYLGGALLASLALFGFMHSYAWLDKVGKGQEDGVAKKKRVMTSWGGPLILFLVLVTFAQQWRAEPGSFSFAVGFKDSSGRTVSIEKGSVMFIMENAQETRVIDKDGRAVFSGIPKSYQGKEVTVRLNAAGWRLEKGETVSCRLTGNRVVLIVKKE